MYQKAIANIKRSIFPIFIEFHQGEKRGLGVAGTGFFINNDGYFITAQHVMADVPAGSKLLYVGNVPHHYLKIALEFEEIYSDASKDIFLGKVSDHSLPGLKLSDKKAEPGKSICLCGYPLPKLSMNPDGSINVKNVRQYWQPTFVIDGIAANINKKQYMGFMTQHTSLRGMSGGPVFDTDGFAYGMDVASLTRRIPESDGKETIVPNGVAVDVATIKETLSEKVSFL